tara:strand:- start:698 stop:1156 length:459 start_codon:yes stop_codon:yes gene_type:complete
MSCPQGLEFDTPYTLEEMRKAMKRKLIDNSYVGEWAEDLDNIADQYAAYASKPLKKGEIVMECLVPYEWLYGTTSQLKDYRIRVEYKTGETRYIVPLGNVLVMNYGNNLEEANCKVQIPETTRDRIVTVIARNDIKQDEELRWLYVGGGSEI